MNEKDFGEHFYNSDNTEIIDKNKVFPTSDADNSSDKVPLDAALIDEWPVEKSNMAFRNLDEIIVQEVPGNETIIFTNNVGKTVGHETSTNGTIGLNEPVVSPSALSTTLSPEEFKITNSGLPAPLLDRTESEYFCTRWNELQARFVDEPRIAVQQADELITEVIVQISQVLINGHNSLDSQWKQSPQISTEDLRKALHSYRFFFNRLLV
jgi:hypothetical protein